MTEKAISQQDYFEFAGNQEVSKESCQCKPYKKPVLLPLDISTDIIAGGSTSNQLENSSGLIGS